MGGGQSYLGEKGEKGEPAVIEPVSEVLISGCVSYKVINNYFFPHTNLESQKNLILESQGGGNFMSLLLDFSLPVLKLQDSTESLTS